MGKRNLAWREFRVGSKEIKQAGLKVTLPRMKILDMLQHQRGVHFSAEEIYRALIESGEDIGLATVYRVLTQFESSGLVKRHHFESGQSVFEINQGQHHDHILCVDCGRVEEFCDEAIELRQQEVAQRIGFELTDHRLILYGHCTRTDCSQPLAESGKERNPKAEPEGK